MRTSKSIVVCTLAALGLTALGASAAGAGSANAGAAVALRGPDAATPGLARELLARWEKSLREVRGWDESAVAHFRAELDTLPSDTLRSALETRNWDTLQDILVRHQGEAAAERLAKAVQDWRSGATLDETDVEDATLKRTVMKLLGDDDKDLVFVPIQPCTVWDTRFATAGSVHQGLIAPNTNRPAMVWNLGGSPFSWVIPQGGNPACTDTAIAATFGVVPSAVAFTLYTADATAQGWVTAYRDGDPDPSSATISLFYTPGPTRSTTAVTKVGRAVGQPFDIRVASQFGSVHVAASVIGYFIRSAATALECQDVTETVGIGGGTNATRTKTCPAGYSVVGGGASAAANTEQIIEASRQSGNGWLTSVFNLSALQRGFQFSARCCRVPGR